MNQSDVAKSDGAHANAAPTMTPEQISIAARRMMAQIEHETRVDFFDHWLTRLGLDPVVSRIEKQFAEKSVVRAEKLKRRGKRN